MITPLCELVEDFNESISVDCERPVDDILEAMAEYIDAAEDLVSRCPASFEQAATGKSATDDFFYRAAIDEVKEKAAVLRAAIEKFN